MVKSNRREISEVFKNYDEPYTDLRESFEDFSDHLKDPRINRNKLHSVEEILFLTLTAVICGCEGWRDIERFGKYKIDFLRKVFPFTFGIPSDDTLRRFFRSLNPTSFKTSFVNWIKTLDISNIDHVCIDGKVSRHSFDEDNNPLCMVSAYASNQKIVLAQEKVADKSNEITAIPKLLDLLDLENATITIDAIGCQRDICQVIVEKKCDYIINLKGNQPNLHNDVKKIFDDISANETSNVNKFKTVDKSSHGRYEEREYSVINCTQEFKEKHNWPFIKSIVEVESLRKTKVDTSIEKRYYVTSLEPNIEKISDCIRSHWAIENSLHWILDITFRDDESRIRKGYAPQNIAIIKHMGLNMLQKSKGKRDSIKQLRKSAGWADAQLATILSKISEL